jgi:hypothetical protein
MEKLNNYINSNLKKDMKKSIIFIAMTILISASFTSCGVMFGGSKYQGSIEVKDHPNAEIYVDGQKLGTGSATKLFPRNRPLVVTVEQEGCEKNTQTFDKAFRTGNFILSAVSWGIIGIGVDLGTGAAYKPDHAGNPSIQKLNTKDFNFSVDYSKCKKP